LHAYIVHFAYRCAHLGLQYHRYTIMASHPRPHRPAATDYFNPTEQIELLQSIKAKVEKSATSTPQESRQPLDQIQQNYYAGVKPVDFKAHELSLREKLEKAKADREAKAKAEVSVSQQPNSTTTIGTIESPQSKVPENKSVEPVIPGPPPPPIISNLTPTPPIQQPVTYGWNPGMYPAVPNYGRPTFQYPQVFPQFGVPSYTNGQAAAYNPQWSQYVASLPTNTTTPGIPPPPPQPNQGPPLQGSPPQGTTSQSPPNQETLNQGAPPPHQSGLLQEGRNVNV